MEKKEPHPLTEELRTARPFVPWVGGKGKLKEIIYQVFPQDVNRFADHCGGSGAMLLGLPPKAGRLDVYNDFDAELTNLFLCVRDRLLALTEELKIFPIQSEAEYAMLRDMLKRRQPIPDFTQDELRAARHILSPELVSMANTLRAMQEMVGGYIEIVHWMTPAWHETMRRSSMVWKATAGSAGRPPVFLSAKEKSTPQRELQRALEELYEKYVPAEMREYLDSKCRPPARPRPRRPQKDSRPEPVRSPDSTAEEVLL